MSLLAWAVRWLSDVDCSSIVICVNYQRYLTFDNATDDGANGVQVKAGKPAEMSKVRADKRTTASNAKLRTDTEGGRTRSSANVRTLWVWKRKAGC